MEGEFDPFGQDDEDDMNNNRRASSSSSSNPKLKSPVNSDKDQQKKKKATKKKSNNGNKADDEGTAFNPFTFVSSSSSDDESSDDQKPRARKKQQQEENKGGDSDDDDDNSSVSYQTQDNETAFYNEAIKKRINKNNNGEGEEAEFNPFNGGDIANDDSPPLPASKAMEEDRRWRTPPASRKRSGSTNDDKKDFNNIKKKKPTSIAREKKATNRRNELFYESDSDSNDGDDKQKGPPVARKNPMSTITAPKRNGTNQPHLGREDDEKKPPARKKQASRKSTGGATTVRSLKRPAAKSRQRNIGGTLKDPPSYSIRQAASTTSNSRTSVAAASTNRRRASTGSVVTTTGNHGSSISNNRTSSVAAASSNGRQASNNGVVSSTANHDGSSSSNTTDSAAHLPLHTTTTAVACPNKSVKGGGILSAKRTRDLDQYMKEKLEPWANQLPKEKQDYYSDLRRKIALMVPTSEMELKADKILEEAVLKKWGKRIVQVIRGFLNSNQISTKYIRKKRKEEEEQLRRNNERRASSSSRDGSRQSNAAAANKPSDIIVMIDDDSDDENDTANGASVNKNTTTEPESTSSSNVARRPLQSSTSRPTSSEEGKTNPTRNGGRTENEESDKKQKANKSSTKRKKRTRDQRDSVAASKATTSPNTSEEGEFNPFGDSKASTSPSNTSEEGEFNPFGDNGNSDSDGEQPQAAPITTQSKKRKREERSSGANVKKSPSAKLSSPATHTASTAPHWKKSGLTRHTATKSPNSRMSRQMKGPTMSRRPTSARTQSTTSDKRHVATKTLDQTRQQNNVAKRASAAQLSTSDSSSSSDDDSVLPPQHPAANLKQDELQGMLSAEQTESLNHLLLSKAKKRAALEREMGNVEIQHSTILPEDTRKKISLLVPTSENDLTTQKIFSDAERREYGQFLLGVIEEFLASQGMSVAEIERKRKSQAAAKNGQIESGKRHPATPTSEAKKKRGKTGKLVGTDLNEQLLGQGYCTEWIDHLGQKLCVFGTVTAYLPEHAEDNAEDDKDNFLTIAHPEHSCSLLNSHHSKFKGLFILESYPVSIARAWGGCLLYQEKHDKMHPVKNKKLFEKKIIPLPSEVTDARAPVVWRVPDLYTTSTMFQKSAPNMPSLCLYYAGFQLEFIVKPSTVPNSGNGVFLSVTSIFDPVVPSSEEAPMFSLQPGEVLDIGVYAPLTQEDETADHIMMVRSVLQSFWCDSYSMNTRSGDSVFDITHGRGDLTRAAKKSILPFVNESPDWNTDWAQIHMVEDPQGSFHYALGYRQDDNDNTITAVPEFRFLADGTPREVFVDYGAQYELVRLRHGYPRFPVTDKERKEMLDKDEREKLDIFFEFTAQQVKDGVECVHQYATTGTMEKVQTLLHEMHDDRNDVHERVLAVIIIFQARIEQLRPEVVKSPRRASAAQRGDTNINLRQRTQKVWYNDDDDDDDDTNDNVADPERLKRRDWDTMDKQLEQVVNKLLPDSNSSPSSLWSMLSKTADSGSILGMACAIATPEVKKTDDDDDVDHEIIDEHGHGNQKETDHGHRLDEIVQDDDDDDEDDDSLEDEYYEPEESQ